MIKAIITWLRNFSIYETKEQMIENYLSKSVDHADLDYRMRQLSSLWDTYKRKYGLNLYAIYQTATDWASKPEGKGMKMNMLRTRSGQVADMIKSDDWLVLITNNQIAQAV